MGKGSPGGQDAFIEDAGPYFRVQYWFFSFPNISMSLNDLSRSVGISKTTANRVVRRLSDEGLLIVEKVGKVWRIRLNQDHIYMRSRKVPFHLSRILESKIIERVKEKVPNVRSIILFGSYRNGDDDENSDIDIAAEVVGDKDTGMVKIGAIASLGYRKNVPVNLHVFSRKNTDMNVFANVANGIVLLGFLEARP